MLSTIKTSFYLAQIDLSARFRAAKLGIHWFYIQQLVWALGAGFVWSLVFGIPLEEFLPYIIISFNAWNFIASFFVDTSAVFQNSAGYLKNTNITPYVYVNKVFVSSLIIFFLGLLPLIIIYPFTSINKFDPNITYLIISILYVMICLSQISYLIAFIGVIIRDLTPALQSLFTILFIASPVIYPPLIMKNKGYGWALDFNPFFHILEILREPLLTGNFASPKNLITVGVIGMIFFIFNFFFIRKKIKNVAIYV